MGKSIFSHSTFHFRCRLLHFEAMHAAANPAENIFNKPAHHENQYTDTVATSKFKENPAHSMYIALKIGIAFHEFTCHLWWLNLCLDNFPLFEKQNRLVWSMWTVQVMYSIVQCTRCSWLIINSHAKYVMNLAHKTYRRSAIHWMNHFMMRYKYKTIRIQIFVFCSQKPYQLYVTTCDKYDIHK